MNKPSISARAGTSHPLGRLTYSCSHTHASQSCNSAQTTCKDTCVWTGVGRASQHEAYRLGNTQPERCKYMQVCSRTRVSCMWHVPIFEPVAVYHDARSRRAPDQCRHQLQHPGHHVQAASRCQAVHEQHSASCAGG